MPENERRPQAVMSGERGKPRSRFSQETPKSDAGWYCQSVMRSSRSGTLNDSRIEPVDQPIEQGRGEDQSVQMPQGQVRGILAAVDGLESQVAHDVAHHQVAQWA